MATVHARRPSFELLQPSTVAAALALLDRHGADATILAGGLDTFDAIVDGVKRPGIVIDLSRVSALNAIRETADGLEIGAMATLAEIARHPIVGERFDLLAAAANTVGSPQIRNQGTIGGNVSQAPRCWYFRSGWSCYRAGGNACYADTPSGLTREHAIFDLDRCVAVNPSDTAPALIALDAKMVIRSSGKAERIVSADEYFQSPSIDITRTTIVDPRELLTAVRIPNTWARARFYHEKVRDRRVWDFAIASVAAALKISGGRVADLRVAVNGVAPRPLRLRAVEDVVRGEAASDALAARAGDLAVRGATSLRDNAYKIPLTRNLVRRAIRAAVL